MPEMLYSASKVIEIRLDANCTSVRALTGMSSAVRASAKAEKAKTSSSKPTKPWILASERDVLPRSTGSWPFKWDLESSVRRGLKLHHIICKKDAIV